MLIALALILFGAFALRLWNLGTQSLWHDEAWSVMSAYQPLTPIDPNYPPFFTVLLGVWIRLAGDSVWSMRFWSLLFGVATVAAVALIVRRWFGDRPAILAAILVAVSPILWVYSQEIRSYVLVPLLVAILLPLTEAVLRSHAYVSRRVWIWLALVEIILLYTHNLAVPVVAWLNVTVIASLALRRDWRRIRTWLLIQIGLLVLYLPWLITQRPTGTPLNTPPVISPALLWDVWQSYFTGIKALVGADDGLMALTAAFGVIALASLIVVLVDVVRTPTPNPSPIKREVLQDKPTASFSPLPSLWRKGPGDGGDYTHLALIVLSQVILIPIFEIIIVLTAHIDFHPRYFLAGVPATLILIAVGLDALTRRRLLTPIALAGAVVLAVGIMVRMAGVVYSSPIYQHDDFRAIAERYAQLGPDDAIIIPYGWEPTLDYYSRKMDFKAKMIGIPLHASADTIIRNLANLDQSIGYYVRSIQLLTWYQLPADLYGAYPCLISSRLLMPGRPTESYVVNGLRSDTYSARDTYSGMFLMWDESSLKINPMDINFGQIKLVGMQDLGTHLYASCIVTYWQLTNPTTENWRVSMRALNSFGWEIAHSDSDVLNDQQLPTTRGSSGETKTAFTLVNLPEGVPINSYPVEVSVYSDKTPQGLDVLVGGHPAGKYANISVAWRSMPDQMPYQITASDIDMGDNLYFHSKVVPTGHLQPGQEARVTIQWTANGDRFDESGVGTFLSVEVRLEGTDWHVSSQSRLEAFPWALSWHQLIIPPTASGHAILKAIAPNGKSIILGEYDITPINRTFTEPAIANRVSANFPGIASLIGLDAPKTANHTELLSMRLIWKVSATPATAYTVFVHLLDTNGQVIAQSDTQPANGDRPTTGWLKDEYVIDSHTLTWNRQGYTGPATLEVGLYDQTTGERVKLADGSDHVVLPMTITVN